MDPLAQFLAASGGAPGGGGPAAPGMGGPPPPGAGPMQPPQAQPGDPTTPPMTPPAPAMGGGGIPGLPSTDPSSPDMQAAFQQAQSDLPGGMNKLDMMVHADMEKVWEAHQSAVAQMQTASAQPAQAPETAPLGVGGNASGAY